MKLPGVVCDECGKYMRRHKLTIHRCHVEEDQDEDKEPSETSDNGSIHKRQEKEISDNSDSEDTLRLRGVVCDKCGKYMRRHKLTRHRCHVEEDQVEDKELSETGSIHKRQEKETSDNCDSEDTEEQNEDGDDENGNKDGDNENDSDTEETEPEVEENEADTYNLWTYF